MVDITSDFIDNSELFSVIDITSSDFYNDVLSVNEYISGNLDNKFNINYTLFKLHSSLYSILFYINEIISDFSSNLDVLDIKDYISKLNNFNYSSKLAIAKLLTIKFTSYFRQLISEFTSNTSKFYVNDYVYKTISYVNNIQTLISKEISSMYQVFTILINKILSMSYYKGIIIVRYVSEIGRLIINSLSEIGERRKEDVLPNGRKVNTSRISIVTKLLNFRSYITDIILRLCEDGRLFFADISENGMKKIEGISEFGRIVYDEATTGFTSVYKYIQTSFNSTMYQIKELIVKSNLLVNQLIEFTTSYVNKITALKTLSFNYIKRIIIIYNQIKQTYTIKLKRTWLYLRCKISKRESE